MALYKENRFRKYDIDKHRWTVTPEYILSEYGEDLNSLSFVREDANPSAAAQRLINILSADLYRYIYEYSNKYKDNRYIVEFLLATNSDWADTYQEALGLYVYSVALSGNMFTVENGLSLDNGKELDMGDIRTQRIPAAVKESLETAPGGSILFRGKISGYDVKKIKALKDAGEY